MNQNDAVNKKTEEALNSMDGAAKATPPAYLLTRINARLQKTPANFWEKATWIIARPSVAFSGLLLLIVLNAIVIIQKKPDNYSTVVEQNTQATPDEFSTISTIYDNENP